MNDTSVPSTLPTVDNQMDDDSNLIMGLVGGGIAMLVSAAIWGAVTYFTEYQIGWMAIGVGFLVGIAVKFFGKGKTPIYGIMSAAFALVGCALGNLLFYSGFIAREEGVAFLEVFFFFLFSPVDTIELFSIAFEFMDILFYGLAAWVGYGAALDIRRNRA